MKKLKFRGNTKGFTLVELIVIISIMGFLAAIITPNILTRIARQKKYKAVEACKQAVSAANQLYDDSVVYKNTFTADAIAQSAGLKGNVKVAVVNGEIVHLFYKDGNESVLYCRYYDEVDGTHHTHDYGQGYTNPYICDGTDVLPAHTELYNYIDDTEAINYYENDIDDVLPEFGSDSGIEYDTETTTAGTGTTSSDDSSGETTTASDGSSEPTTSSNASKPFIFSSNTDYSLGGDSAERMYKIVTDWLDSQFFQNPTNVIAKDNWAATGGMTYQLQNGSVPLGAKWDSSTNSMVDQEPTLSVSQSPKKITSYKGSDGYYYVCLEGSVPGSGINLFDQNQDMTIVDWDGTTKTVKQNPAKFLNIDSNGNYVKTDPEVYAENINRMLVSPKSIIDNIENAMANVAASEASSNSSKVIKVSLTDDSRVCSRRYVSPSDNYTWHVVTYEGADRAVSQGDVYVDPTVGTIEIYWNSNGNGLGWFPIAYYPGYTP